VNCHTWEACSRNWRVEFQCVLTSIIGRTVIRNLAVRQSMHMFLRPGVSILITVSILCFMKISFRSFNIA